MTSGSTTARPGRALLGIALWLGLSAASAGEIGVPVRFDFEFLRTTLEEQVYTGEDTTLRAWDDGTGCNFLVLTAPSFDTRDGRLRVVTAGQARFGTAVAGRCLSLVNWNGFIELFEQPEVEPGEAVVRFRVVDSNIYNQNWEKGLASGTLWDWVKRYVHPRMESMRVDLGPALAEIRAVLPSLIRGGPAGPISLVVDSLRLAEVSAADDGLVAELRLWTPDLPAPEPAPEAPLSAEEMEHWEMAFQLAWQSWDAFFTFIVKQAATDTEAEDLRRALRDVLLDSRHDLVSALTDPDPQGPDPVRALFLESWPRLAPVLSRLSAGLPGQQALRHLGFVAAGDVLTALDRSGPLLGIDVSAHGLRRLARMLAPLVEDRALVYSLEVDPELRRLLGFGPPLDPPRENPGVDLLGWLIPRAWAALGPEEPLVSRLNEWVPDLAEIGLYLPMVRDLLNQTARATLFREELEERFHPLFRDLVLATAWQESCWRQFVRRGEAIKPITSSAGAVGLMQINQNVWRGLYDVDGLRRDIAYNARAGNEILLHYLRDYAIARGELDKSGSLDGLAQATYGVYNGGPRHLSRYRNPEAPAALQRIDRAFLEKYQAVRDGDELAVASCYQ